MLDLDFDQSIHRPLRMKESTTTPTFLQRLQVDLEYLKSLGAMNYSLEIGIYRKRRRTDDDDDLADGRAHGRGREGRCFEHVDGEHL